MIIRKLFLLSLIPGLFTLAKGQSDPVNHWESVVYASDTWHYFVGITSGPVAGWQNPGFNDGAWMQGPGGIGYEDGDDATLIVVPPVPTSLFTRIVFTISDTSQIATALLNMDYDDGFVAWINGVEVARANLGIAGDYPAYNTLASDHEAVMKTGGNPQSFLIPKQKLSQCLVNGDNVLAIQVNNMSLTSSDMSCIAFLSVGLKNAGVIYRPVPAWFTVPYTGFSGSYLPLIIIETSGSIQGDTKILADLGIIDNGPGMLNKLTDDRNNYNGKAGIEYRGSSSSMFPKRGYSFELWKSENIDTAFALLGMPEESDWVLHGPYSDKTLMRNFMAYKLFHSMGYYAPRTEFCEMFLNGQYQGVYVLVEKIKRDKNRVDISKLEPIDVVGDQLTGGYIVKIDRSATDYSDGWFSPYIGTGTGNQGPFYAYHYPKRTEIVQIQKDYIRNKITAFEWALSSTNYKDPVSGYRPFIDVPSFINYFILVELSKNTDGFRLSTYLHKDRDSKDPRIHMGPVWDYDLAFGNADYLDAFNTSGWNYTVPADGWGTPFWWSRFMNDPYFVNTLNCYWHSLRQDILSDESLMALVDSTADALGDAVDRNFDQWPIHGSYVWPNVFVGNSYNEDVNFMKNWILDRAAWMDANVPGVFCTTGPGEHEGSLTLSLRAYPNPAVGEISIEVQNSENEEIKMEVINFTGQLVYTRNIGNEPLFIDRIVLQPGVYLVKVSGEKRSQTTRIVIQ